MRDLARKEQMVRSIDPRRVTLRQFQWPLQAAAVLGTHVAVTILASGHVRPQQQAAHMEANDPIEFSVQPLQEGAVHIWNWQPDQLSIAEAA
jgi:hypothetical protein